MYEPTKHKIFLLGIPDFDTTRAHIYIYYSTVNKYNNELQTQSRQMTYIK